MSQPENRSGIDPEWVNGLTDITGPECDEFIADIEARTPLRGCDVPACSSMAEFLVSFHGCTRFCTCDFHRTAWAMGMARAIQHNGSIRCETCNMYGYSVESVMQWFPI